MESEKWTDVNLVSSMLKLFFRKLPDPLITDGKKLRFCCFITVGCNFGVVTCLTLKNCFSLYQNCYFVCGIVAHYALSKFCVQNCKFWCFYYSYCSLVVLHIFIAVIVTFSFDVTVKHADLMNCKS